jgi:hypothetical protein
MNKQCGMGNCAFLYEICLKSDLGKAWRSRNKSRHLLFLGRAPPTQALQEVGREAPLLVSRPMDFCLAQDLNRLPGKYNNGSWGCFYKMRMLQTSEHIISCTMFKYLNMYQCIILFPRFPFLKWGGATIENQEKHLNEQTMWDGQLYIFV